MHKNLHDYRGIEPFLTLRSLAMSQREGDPVIQKPFLLERQDREQEIFVDVLEALAAPKAVCVKRPGDERLELVGSLHLAITCFASVVSRRA